MRVSRLTAIAAAGVVGGLACARDSPPAIFEAVAHSGDPAPGIPGFTLWALGLPTIDAEGNVLFMAALDGPGVHEGNGLALFYGPPGNVQKLIWASEPAPDMPEGTIISTLMYSSEDLCEIGWIAFTAGVEGPGIMPGLNDQVLYVGPPGDLQVVLQAGDQAPGCEPGVTIQPDYWGGMQSDNGMLLVGADLGGSGDPFDRANWIGTRDNLELV